MFTSTLDPSWIAVEFAEEAELLDDLPIAARDHFAGIARGPIVEAAAGSHPVACPPGIGPPEMGVPR